MGLLDALKKGNGYKNMELNVRDIREYNIDYPEEGTKFSPSCGTINEKKNMSLFRYDGPSEEGKDTQMFVFDYNGVVVLAEMKMELARGEVHWYLVNLQTKSAVSMTDVTEELRDAMTEYGYEGYNPMGSGSSKIKVRIDF